MCVLQLPKLIHKKVHMLMFVILLLNNSEIEPSICVLFLSETSVCMYLLLFETKCCECSFSSDHNPHNVYPISFD